ncbi:MAG: iron uptake system protein EfeO [Neisseriaceae bacterium]|nr:iron uptake system protein EfeO [Neisseriaceae bacterium]
MSTALFESVWWRGALLAPVLALAACGGEGKEKGAAKEDIQEVKITILEHECDPMELTIKSGKTRFLINNQSNRAVEWEILKGVRIIDERENIPPGFTQKMTTTLDPDTYEMACGLLSNPRGKLIVEAAAGADSTRKPTPVELVGAVAEYKVYVSTEVGALLQGARAMVDAIQANDVKAAQALYVPTLAHYETIEPVLKQFSTLDMAIAADESVFADQAADPKFKGLHKLEKGLFGEKSTAGLAPVATQLVSDIEALQKEVAALSVPADQMIQFAAALLREAEQGKLQGQKNRYAKTDVAGVKANVAGSYRIYRLVAPMLTKAHPDMAKEIKTAYEALLALLQPYADQTPLSAADQATLKQQLAAQEARLAELPEALGLN